MGKIMIKEANHMQMSDGTKEYIKSYWDESSRNYDDKSGHGIQTAEERMSERGRLRQCSQRGA